MNSIMLQRFSDALRTIPRPGGAGCHSALLGVANLGVLAGLQDYDIQASIRASIPAGTRTVPDGEIRDAITRSRHDTEPLTGSTTFKTRVPQIPPSRQKFTEAETVDWSAYRDALIARSDGAEDVDLWELSAVKPDWEPGYMDAVALIDALYAPEDLLFAGDDQTPGEVGRTIKPAGEWSHIIKQRGAVISPKFIANPLSGSLATKANGDGVTLRGDGCVSVHRFALVEFDELPEAKQLAFWHSIITSELFPVSALYTSGGKSVHALLRVDLPNVEAWNRDVKRGLYGADGVLTACGADKACCNPARLTRLPGHFRNGNCQRLLYLNPTIGSNA